MKKTSRQKAIESARKLMLDKGKDGVRMQEIADHAGVNKGLLHYYFKNKENLFNEVFIDEFNKIYAELNDILSSKDTMDGKLSRMIEQYFDLLHEDHKRSSFVMFEINKNPNLIKELSDQNALDTTIQLLDAEFKYNGLISSPSFAFQVLLNIISMCVFPFMMKPLIEDVGKRTGKDWESIMTERKEFLKSIIINSFKV